MMLVGFDGTTIAEASTTATLIGRGMLDAVVLFADGPFNVESPAQVAQLTLDLMVHSPNRPLIIACDQEGGLVARLNDRHGFPPTVSEQFLGELDDLAQTRQYAGEMAATLAAAGINLNLAPVVDVNVNPDNPVIGAIGRSFSQDPEVVAEQALAFIASMHEKGVLCTLKHFPGHGSSTSDSHLGFVDVSATWSDAELIPFRRVIEAGQADAVMTAHIFNSNLDPDYPATLSHATITGVLREQLGFDGVVISDSITMRAISDHYGFTQGIELAINAGVDMISISDATVNGQNSADVMRTAIVDAVNGGRIPASRIDESYARIAALAARI